MQASDRPASDTPVQSAAAQHAQRPTVAEPPAEPEKDFPTPTNPPLWPEAAKLTDVPSVSQLAPTPAWAEERQSEDAIDSQAAPSSDPPSDPPSPAIERSLPPSAPHHSTDDADHTLALAMIVFWTIAIFGSALEVMRWLHRRKSGSCSAREWATSNEALPGINSGLPGRQIPPLSKPLGEAESLAHDLQKILDELRTRPSASLYVQSDLTRSS